MKTLNKVYKGELENPELFCKKDCFTIYLKNSYLGNNNNGDVIYVSIYYGTVTSKVGFISNGELRHEKGITGGTIEVRPSNSDFVDLTFEGTVRTITLFIMGKDTEIYIPNLFYKVEMFDFANDPAGQHGKLFLGMKEPVECQPLRDLKFRCDTVTVDGDVKVIKDLNLTSFVFLKECGIRGDIKYIPSTITNLQIPNSGLYGNIKDLKTYNATLVLLSGNNIIGDLKDFFDACVSHGRTSGTMRVYSELCYNGNPIYNCQADFSNGSYTVTQL